MTDHLADARACIQSAAQAPHTGCTLSWLTATCEQIIAHLEAQQTEASLRRGLADITAGRTVDLGSFAQPEPEQLGGSDFMARMAGRLADPEVLAGYLAAHEREVREQIASEIQHEAEAMARVNAHPSEGIRDGLAAAARIARQEQP